MGAAKNKDHQINHLQLLPLLLETDMVNISFALKERLNALLIAKAEMKLYYISISR